MRLKNTFFYILIIIAEVIIFSCYFSFSEKQLSIDNIDDIHHLNTISEFSFIIFSDHDGKALDNLYFSKMDTIRTSTNVEFAIGLGDHVKKHSNKNFLNLLKNDEWWRDNFFPNIADGENETFGSWQGDWGAGGKLLEYVSFARADMIEMRDNKAEYYAQIKVKDYTIHLIQLHFPDTPHDVSVAFKQDSRDYLINTLKKIKKNKNDIIIVGAHSYSGFWHHLLSKDEQKILYQKADLILSGTSHIFDRAIDPINGEKGTLILNTGSVTDPMLIAPPGFLQVNVIKNPNTIIVQYIDLREKYQLADEKYRFVKSKK